MRERVIYVLYSITGALSFILGEHQMMFNILMLAMLLYTILGILKGIRFKHFSSNKLTRGVISRFLGLLIILGVEYATLGGNLSLTNEIMAGVFGVLIISEFISILQNYQMVRTGKEIEEWDIVSGFISNVLEHLKDFIEKIRFVKK